jgi:hypothetical protein
MESPPIKFLVCPFGKEKAVKEVPEYSAHICDSCAKMANSSGIPALSAFTVPNAAS